MVQELIIFVISENRIEFTYLLLLFSSQACLNMYIFFYWIMKDKCRYVNNAVISYFWVDKNGVWEIVGLYVFVWLNLRSQETAIWHTIISSQHRTEKLSF